MADVLSIEDLTVSFGGYGADTSAVRGVSLSVGGGEILALVGESGSGKSVTAQSILRLNPAPPARVSARRLELCGHDILAASERDMESIRGRCAGMVFQDPMTCLNPTMRVGEQITEGLLRKEGMPAKRCREEAVRLLELVRIPDAARRARQYPHQFSGGMRQRVMLALALAARPRLLIADEPTTALDVTTQLQILALISRIRAELGTAVLLITHDLGVVANLADRVAVMYAGRIVETAEVEALFARRAHPYTEELLRSLSPLHAPEKGSAVPEYAAAVGCPFAPRCPDCMRVCVREEPPLLRVDGGHQAACWKLHERCP